MNLALHVLALAPLLVAPASASVLTVGTSGQQFTTIQAAIDAAVDGDVILVRAGSYVRFDIDGKALTLVGENVVSRGLSRIRNVPAGKTVTVSTLTITGSSASSVAGLQITSCDGIVRVQDVLVGAVLQQPGLDVAQSSQVCVSRCVLAGSASFVSGSSAFPPGPGLRIENATVALHSTTTTGGNGVNGGSTFNPTPALAGAPACELREGAQLFVSGSLLTAGNGGNGANAQCATMFAARAGADGANTLEIAATAQADLHDVVLVPGTGGIGGAGSSSGSCTLTAAPMGNAGQQLGGNAANVATLAGSHRRLTGVPLAREGQSATLTFDGVAGDSVILVWARNPSHLLALPFGGVVTYATPLRRLPMGTIPGSGSLTVDLPIAELGAGVESSLRYVQAFIRDASNQVTLSDPMTLVLLDAGF